MLVKNGAHKALVPPTTDTHITLGPHISTKIAMRMRGSHFALHANRAEIGQSDGSVYESGKMGIVNVVGRLDVVYNVCKVAVPA